MEEGAEGAAATTSEPMTIGQTLALGAGALEVAATELELAAS